MAKQDVATILSSVPYVLRSTSPGGGVLFLRGRRQSQSWVIVILLLRNLAVGIDREAVHNAQHAGWIGNPNI